MVQAASSPWARRREADLAPVEDGHDRLCWALRKEKVGGGHTCGGRPAKAASPPAHRATIPTSKLLSSANGEIRPVYQAMRLARRHQWCCRGVIIPTSVRKSTTFLPLSSMLFRKYGLSRL